MTVAAATARMFGDSAAIAGAGLAEPCLRKLTASWRLRIVEGTVVLQPVLKIAGIEVPSKSPMFLTVLTFHVLGGVVCVVTGIVAMLSKKRPSRHPAFGTIYYWSLAVVFTSATALATIRFAEDYPLFILGTISFGLASLGRTARRWRWRNWTNVHISSMGFSYIVMLTAFYVDNGKSLPVWRDLPHLTYWLLPALVGIPLIVRALVRYRQPQKAVMGNVG